jgi:hypothetical protein
MQQTFFELWYSLWRQVSNLPVNNGKLETCRHKLYHYAFLARVETN